MTQPDSRIYWHNQRWYDHTGISLDERESWVWLNVQHPNYLKGVVKFGANVCSAGELFEVLSHCGAKMGSTAGS